MIVRISTALHARLVDLAAADRAREVCGLLLGTTGRIDALIEADNVAPDPRALFEIDPRVQIDAVKAARRGGPAILGCYHSHPSGVARPSAWDLQMAHPDSLWLIVADRDVALWHRTETGFERVELLIIPD